MASVLTPDGTYSILFNRSSTRRFATALCADQVGAKATDPSRVIPSSSITDVLFIFSSLVILINPIVGLLLGSGLYAHTAMKWVVTYREALPPFKTALCGSQTPSRSTIYPVFSAT